MGLAKASATYATFAPGSEIWVVNSVFLDILSGWLDGGSSVLEGLHLLLNIVYAHFSLTERLLKWSQQPSATIFPDQGATALAATLPMRCLCWSYGFDGRRGRLHRPYFP